ncbi:MAG: 2-oxoglutarate dehydrogenase complex dihydrolipoyllysine-residue succinyltransferase [Gammaproteobacteria bacterium]|nr:2-oxoglutarate dehydrogenase complex dihydrolipoyllysine-residue succinyltransferase [Gammaproteobacteria bacterium]
MIVDVTVPLLPESVPDGVLLQWTKRPGDTVIRSEVLSELETDKIVMEIPAPAGGVLLEILEPAGTTVVAGRAIARIDTTAVAEAPGSVQAPEPVQARANNQPPAVSATTAAPPTVAPMSAAGPAARKAMAESGVDPTTIEGSGPGGRITKEDVMSMANAGPSPAPAPTAPISTVPVSPAPVSLAPVSQDPASTAPATAQAKSAPAVAQARGERRVPMTRLRQRIAERLVDAQHTAAILSTFNEVDMGAVMALRKRLRDDFEKTHGVRLGFMSFFAKAAVQALQRFPVVNAYMDGTDMLYHDYCDIGVAVASPRGLVVPVLRNVEAMSFAEIESKIAEFGQRARSGTLTLDELTGGTFTISNGGVFGSMLSTPILNPPQSAILGMHKTQERPVVENGEIIIRPIMYLALSYDHRIIDGQEAVRFLVTIKECIEDPGRMLLGT